MSTIHLDTTFLVDLLRATARKQEGPADRMLSTLDNEELWVSVHVCCELWAGVRLVEKPKREQARVEALLGALEVAYPDDRFAPAYGRLLADMTRRGQRIANMDLLIATAALVDDAPLLTRNDKDFSRVPGLRLLSY